MKRKQVSDYITIPFGSFESVKEEFEKFEKRIVAEGFQEVEIGSDSRDAYEIEVKYFRPETDKEYSDRKTAAAKQRERTKKLKDFSIEKRRKLYEELRLEFGS